MPANPLASEPAPPPASSLAGNAFWAVLGNLFYAGGRFLIIILLTKFFPSDEVGRAFYALAVVTPLSFVVNLELRSVFVTDPRGWIRPGHCLASRLLSNIAFAAILAALVALQWHAWSADKIVVLLLVGAIRVAESWADVYLGVFQKHERMKNWAISQAVKTALVLAWALVVALFFSRIAWFLLGWCIVTLIVLWVYDRRRAAESASLKFEWDPAVAKRLLRFGLPLGLFVAMASGNQYVAQYFIEPALGDSAVAHFAALMAVVSGLAAVQNGVNQAILPRLAHYYLRDLGEFWRLLGRVLGLSWIVLAGVLLLVWWQGRNILLLLYEPEYAQFDRLFLVVVFAGSLVLTGMALGDAIIACQRFKSRAAAVACGLGANALVCWFFVGKYGLTAAAWAAAVAGAVICLYCTAVLIRSCRKAPHA